MSDKPAQLTAIPGVPNTHGNENAVQKATHYISLHDENVKSEVRNEKYKEMVTEYYDLATDFYEKGWGESFHFCKQYKNETYREAIRRHEYYLASRLHLRDGMVCLDVGCGIGGPLRNIARFSGSCGFIIFFFPSSVMKKLLIFSYLSLLICNTFLCSLDDI
jgi:sterol 24-C-methyltransferase